MSLNSIESDSTFFIFQERQNVTLTTALAVRGYVDGSNDVVAETLPNSIVPAGTTVCSWLLRFDTATNTVGVRAGSAVVDFHQPILGFATEDNDLAATNQLARNGVDYAANHSLGDTDTLSISGSVLTVNWLSLIHI